MRPPRTVRQIYRNDEKGRTRFPKVRGVKDSGLSDRQGKLCLHTTLRVNAQPRERDSTGPAGYPQPGK